MTGTNRSGRRMPSAGGSWRTHLTGLVVVASIAGSGLYLGLRPVLARRVQTRDLLVQQADLNAGLDRMRGTERLLRDELRELELLGAGWDAREGHTGSLNESMAALTDIGQQAGLRLHTVRADDPNPLEFFAVTPIVVEGSGGYEASANFIARVLETVPNVTVERFSVVAPPPGSDEDGTVSFVFAWYDDSAGHAGENSGASG